MEIQVSDFNNAQQLFGAHLTQRWAEVQATLENIPPHLKPSDQAGIQGTLIFDPVGTNAAIKIGMEQRGWQANVAIPTKFRFLGTDVDFVKSGALVEVQFSNYPFLLNNTVRAELLFRSRSLMAGSPIDALIIITKAHMFPASNSTLYYEQAVKQLTELSNNNVLDVPIRLVGLFCQQGVVGATLTGYHQARYSRTVVDRETRQVRVLLGSSVRSRCRITLV